MIKGNLIVFEGIDGSGKSTQFDMLCERFEKESRAFRRIRFPRYDKPSSALIKMYLDGELGNSPDDVNAYAASSFYAVDRYSSFLQDWREYYESGGLILTDRYTTSNALHQGAKVPDDERERFFDWLYNYEFDLLGLPRPDLVMFLDIEAKIAASRIFKRQTETGTDRDIHERDAQYLEKCAQVGKQAAEAYNWHTVCCVDGDGAERNEDELHDAVYNAVMKHLADSYNLGE
jgi:dTMP kinase